MNIKRLTLSLLLLTAFALPAAAHRLGESYLYLQVYEERITGRFEIALTDLNPALGLSGTDQEITPDNLLEHIGFLQTYYREKVKLETPQGPVTLRWSGQSVLNAHGGYVMMPFEFGGVEGVPEKITVDYSVLFDEEPKHRGFLLVEHNWATGTFANESGISLVFSPDKRRQDFDLTTSGFWPGFFAVLNLGMEHIWEGIDHILFLIALLIPAVLRREDGPGPRGTWFPVDKFMPALINVVKIVTAFTVAHSITLSLASLGIVSLPGKLVEVIIAASIAIAAADLIFPIFRGKVWMIVAGFGLFHGFGFAGALSEMGVLHEKIGPSLLAFNLGVEIGQVVIVAILVPILFLARNLKLYIKVGLPAAAIFLILVSGVWVSERAFGIDIPMRELLPKPIQKIIP